MIILCDSTLVSRLLHSSVTLQKCRRTRGAFSWESSSRSCTILTGMDDNQLSSLIPKMGVESHKTRRLSPSLFRHVSMVDLRYRSSTSKPAMCDWLGLSSRSSRYCVRSGSTVFTSTLSSDCRLFSCLRSSCNRRAGSVSTEIRSPKIILRAVSPANQQTSIAVLLSSVSTFATTPQRSYGMCSVIEQSSVLHDRALRTCTVGCLLFRRSVKAQL